MCISLKISIAANSNTCTEPVTWDSYKLKGKKLLVLVILKPPKWQPHGSI